MKNKKTIWLLAPLVLIIWGLVFYRIVCLGKDEHGLMADTGRPAVKPTDKPLQKDTFSIVADYRDPFLGAFPKKKVISLHAVSKPKAVQPPPPIINWPSISFGGVIKNNHSNKQVAIVRVNQKEVLMAVNDVSQGIELTQIFNKDSIRVSFQDNNKVIRKQ